MEPSAALHFASSLRGSSCVRGVAALAAATIMLVPGLALGSGLASDRGAEVGEEQVQLHLRWRTSPPTLRLQPESARLVLNLPVGWMPPPDPGRLGVPLDPNKRWYFRSAQHLTSASVGAGLRLSIEDRARSLWFGVSVLPRAAVAVLRFDPLPPQLR